MPGNEVGDRIHNFFGQENLIHGQHHSQVVDGNWNGLTNNPWAASQRQIGTSFISNLKSPSVQEAVGYERGHGGQSSGVQNAANLSPSNLRPDLARSLPQGQQAALNGYMQGHQVFHSRLNEANFLGLNTEPDQCNITAKGFSTFQSELGNGPDIHNKNSGRMDFTELPVNYDHFRGQQQMSSQNAGQLPSLPRQQSGISDVQLLQQQLMLNQMQEMQRQQLLQKQHVQQQESRQPSSGTQLSSFAKQAGGSHPSSLVNGIPVNDVSNYSWQPELVGANTNWAQRGFSPVMQGSFRGNVFSPEPGQVPHLMNMIPQRVDQSLYGVPVSGVRVTSSDYSPIQLDKLQQMSGNSNSFRSNQYTGFQDRVNLQTGSLVPRQGNQGRNVVGSNDAQAINSGFDLGTLQHVNAQQGNEPPQEYPERHELSGPLDASHEKTVMQVGPSQNVATLDPTEERILFGSDDNLWDAFGKGTTGGYNSLGGTDVIGSFPSMQSGSWSALMQSAVAETSSSDVGVQEEWTGLTISNSETPRGNQKAPTINNSGKQQPTWADYSLQSASHMKTRPLLLSHETHGNMNFNNVLEVQQSVDKNSHEQSEVLHTGPLRSSQQFQGDGHRWLDCNTQRREAPEGSNVGGKIPYFSDAEANMKISGSWTNQQSTSGDNTNDQQCDKPDGWNFFHHVLPRTSTALKNLATENSFDGSKSSNEKNSIMEAVGRGASIGRADSFSTSVVDLEHAKSRATGSHVDLNDQNLNNVAASQASTFLRANQESSQHMPITSNIDIWKHVDPTVNAKGNEIPGTYRPYANKFNQNFESAGNNSLSNGTLETHEMQSSSVKETMMDDFHRAHHASSVGLRENTRSDEKESCVSSGSKQSSSDITRKPPGIRKFQYHPMGNLDVDSDSSRDAKHVTRPQSMMQQVYHGLKGHDLRFTGPSKTSMEIEKGGMASFQGETKGLNEISSKSFLQGSTPRTFAPSDGAATNYAPNQSMVSSQNMLQLPQKVDKSLGHGISTQFGLSNRNQSSDVIEPEKSDGSVHPQQGQSSTSRGFGLQLTLPSQPLGPENTFLNQKPTQNTNVLTSAHLVSDTGEKSHAWLPSTSFVQSMPSQLRNNSSGQRNKNLQGNLSSTFPSGFPFARNLPKQVDADTDTQVKTSQSTSVSFNGLASHSKESLQKGQINESMPDSFRNRSHNDNASSAEMSLNHARDSAQQFPVLESVPAHHYTASVMSQEDASKLCSADGASVSSQHRTFGSQPSKSLSNMFRPNLATNNNSETVSSRAQKVEDPNAQNGGSSASESGFLRKEQLAKEDSSQPVSPGKDPSKMTMSAGRGKESGSVHVSGASLANPTSTETEIEAFGQSLRSNNVQHQNYSLPHQVLGTRNTDLDPSNRTLKRFRGPDNDLDAQFGATHGGQQLSGHNNMVGDTSTNHGSISSGDYKMLSFSATGDQESNASLQHSLAFGQSDHQNVTGGSSAVSVRGQQSQISPQMAPSWFDQFGTFKNGQILSRFEGQRSTTIKRPDLPFPIGKPFDKMHVLSSFEHSNDVAVDGRRPDSVQNSSSSTPASLASENPPGSELALADADDMNLAVARLKKRKTFMSDLLPLHKEVMQGPKMLYNMSMAEVDWAQATNRMTEKVEDEADMVDDVPPVYKSKRRLILNTQLLQLLLQAPSASVLSQDAISHYENAVYSIARSTLGDACNRVSGARSGISVPSNSGNLHPEELKATGRISDQYFSKVMEDLISRGKKLESEILRLENRASVLDLRLECQDLEKVSVINRFAKFHGRGQSEVAETTSTSDSAATTQKFPQRYVTALPMPKNLPDMVQCLSL